jgi:N-methylhydantoinase B
MRCETWLFETLVRSEGLPCDPVTFEILRHKLHSVIDEAIISLENVSGSPITNEGHDMMVSLYRADGSLMLGGVGYLYHLTSASQAVTHILETYGEEPGINPGDVYLLNDPYTAALHPPDMYVISPVHHEGKLAAFVANFVHLTDIGAMTPGGFCPTATDTFQEGFVTAGLKLVEGGTLRTDVFDTILNNVRDPGITGLDLRSQMAANHTATTRILELFDNYGRELVDAVAETLIDQSEQQLRHRLGSLPDGEWYARQYVDLPEGVRKVFLRLSKTGDSLEFDFEGTDRQSAVGVNATCWGTMGGVFAGVFPLLAWDITWNDGVTRPIRIVAPEDTLVHCRRPAPISIATVGIVKVVSSLAAVVISKMLGTSPQHQHRPTATWKGIHMNLEVFGRRSGGEYFVTLMTDSFAGSGGARATDDGVDLGGEISNQVGRWANAESQELNTPLRYLFRRPVTDSGGPGRFRGGVSHELGLVPHGSDGNGFSIGTFAMGVSVPFSQGLQGGYPGSHVEFAIRRNRSHGALSEIAPDGGGPDWENAHWGHFEVGDQDMLYIRGVGGGGYGDPIEREPARVAGDVAMDLVSVEAAYGIYGVELTSDYRVKEHETLLRRTDIRRIRLGQPPFREPDMDSVQPNGRPLSDYLQVTLDGDVQCTRCGHVVSTSDDRHWKEDVVSVRLSPAATGVYRASLPGVALIQFVCGACGTLLDSDLVLDDDSPLLDRVNGWPGDS